MREEEKGVIVLRGFVCCVGVWYERGAQGGVGGLLRGETGYVLHGAQ